MEDRKWGIVNRRDFGWEECFVGVILAERNWREGGGGGCFSNPKLERIWRGEGFG